MSGKNSLANMPENFKMPFTRVVMRERMDDAFACIAALTGKSLEEVNRAAVTFGYPPFGPAYPTEVLMAKLLMSLGGLVATNYKEFTSVAALPEVAILFIDLDEEMDTGRTVIFHHVKATATQTSFNYVIDPASWIDEARSIRIDVGSLDIAWYMEITAASVDQARR